MHLNKGNKPYKRHSRTGGPLLQVFLAVLLLLVLRPTARAAFYRVTTTADGVGLVALHSGTQAAPHIATTLRGAIIAANANSDADTILLNAVSANNLTVLVGLPITFGSPVLGSISNADTQIASSGMAGATFNAGNQSETAHATATVDSAGVVVDITIINHAPTANNQNVTVNQDMAKTITLTGATRTATR